MTNTIALCGIEDEISRTLEQYGGYRILRFFDEPERRGDVKLAYYLRDGPRVSLTVVGYPGAEGLSACDYLRAQSRALPIIWLCNRREFESEAKRLNVCFCSTGPPGEKNLFAMLMHVGFLSSTELAACSGR